VTSADGRVVRNSWAALNPKKEKKNREHVRGPIPVARQALERKKYKYNATSHRLFTKKIRGEARKIRKFHF
jgi:hypothetical protein